ncbi:MAG: translocation/assembly module TamB domain-containing protein, partial [Cyanobacteria bacterium J06607_10]
NQTVIPPTQTDKSTVTVDEIDIAIGLRSLIFQRVVKPKITLVNPKVSLVQAEDDTWGQLSLPELAEEGKPPVTVEIQTIEIKNAELTATPYTQDSQAVVERGTLEVDDVNGLIEFYGGENAQEVAFAVSADVETGEVDIKGAANLEERAIKTNLRARDLRAVWVNTFLPDSMGLRAGTLNSNLDVVAALTDDNKLDREVTQATGTAYFRGGELLTSALSQPVQDISSRLVFKGQRVTLEDAGLRLDDVVLKASGDVDLAEGYDLTAQIPAVSLLQVERIAAVELPDNLDGTFRLAAQLTGELESPQATGSVFNLLPLQADRLSIEAVAADFDITPSQLDLTSLRIVPEAGGEIVAVGSADLTDLDALPFQLTAEAAGLPADVYAAVYGVSVPLEIVVGRVDADIEAAGTLASQSAFVDWQLSDSTFPGAGEIALVNNLVTLDNTLLRIADGTVSAEATLALEDGNWQADVTTSQVPVEQFVGQIDGLLSADIVAAGNVNALDLEQIQLGGEAAIANAQLYLPQTNEPLLDRGDWLTAFEWAGDRIAVDTFTAPGIQADGTIGVDFNNAIPIGNLDLNVALQSFNLQPFNSFIPPNIEEYAQLEGLTSFDGNLSGTLENPRVDGNARLDSLRANQLTFEPLSGPVAFSFSNGGQVNLQGQQDQLQLRVDGSVQQSFQQGTLPEIDFEVRNERFIATGYGEGNALHADVEQLPLSRLGIRPAPQYGFGRVGGLLTASVDVRFADFLNLETVEAEGEVDVAMPDIALLTSGQFDNSIDAEQFTADFAYANRTATLTQGELLFDDSRYLLNATASLTPEIQYDAALTIADGRVEDLVPIAQQIAQTLELNAFGLDIAQAPLGSAADLAVQPAGVPANSTFLEKLISFVTFLEENPERETAPGSFALPEIEDLAGQFTGEVKVAGVSLSPEALAADFNVQGEGWEWGDDTPPNEFALRGDVQQGTVDIETAFVDAGETEIDLVGSGSLEDLEGELTVENLPVALAGLFYPLPVDVEGDLNIITTFNGSLANPLVKGSATVVDAQINQQSIDAVVANFIYRDAVASIDSEVSLLPDVLSNGLPDLSSEGSSVQVRDADIENPITLQGNIPFVLPFMTVEPATDQLDLLAVVPNSSFEVLNAFLDNQLRWDSGQGEAVVEVGGTLAQPTVDGRASFRDGTISSALLQDSLTNVNGDVTFDLTRVEVQQLYATMGDGRVVVSGALPLLPSGQSLLLQRQLTSESGSFSSSSSSSSSASAPSATVAMLLKQAQRPVEQIPDPATGLQISLESLPINYSGAVQAVLDGQILVTEAALSPTIGGAIGVNNGQVQANQLLRDLGSLDLPTAEEIDAVSPYRLDYLGEAALDNPLEVDRPARPEGLLAKVSLQDLEIVFGDQLNIIGTPLYNIEAVGEVTINGTLAALSPSGVIALESGWINLFSTQFRLDDSAPNTATFSPENGLNPMVDVVMTARVQKTDTRPAPPSAGGFLNADVASTPVESFGSVRYIEVQAVATGPATELGDNLLLTSDPPRPQGELLALVGNNVFSNITSVSYLQAAEFLGFGGLTGIGDRIADAVGLDSFSVFPATDPDADSAVGLGLGVSASASLGDRIDITFQEILNSSNPPRLGVDYRLTDQLEIQSSSNFENTDFKIEYRIEF